MIVSKGKEGTNILNATVNGIASHLKKSKWFFFNNYNDVREELYHILKRSLELNVVQSQHFEAAWKNNNVSYDLIQLPPNHLQGQGLYPHMFRCRATKPIRMQNQVFGAAILHLRKGNDGFELEAGSLVTVLRISDDVTPAKVCPSVSAIDAPFTGLSYRDLLATLIGDAPYVTKEFISNYLVEVMQDIIADESFFTNDLLANPAWNNFQDTVRCYRDHGYDYPLLNSNWAMQYSVSPAPGNKYRIEVFTSPVSRICAFEVHLDVDETNQLHMKEYVNLQYNNHQTFPV